MSDELDAQATGTTEEGAGAATEPEATGAGEATQQGDATQQTDDQAEEQRERSRLGRKLAAMERTLAEREEAHAREMTDLKNLLLATVSSKEGNGGQTEEDVPDDTYLTAADVRKLLKKELREQAPVVMNQMTEAQKQAQVQYERSYMKHLDNLAAEEDETVHEAIVKEMLENFNVKHSSDPAADAERNYYRAAASMAKKAGGLKRQVNVKGGKDSLPSGVGGDSKSRTKEAEIPELDEAALDFVQKTGMSPESVKRALAGSGKRK